MTWNWNWLIWQPFWNGTTFHFILFFFFWQNYMFYRAYLYGANFIAKFRWESGFLWVLGSGGIKGGAWGHFPPPSLRLCPPPHLPTPSVEKNGQNQLFLAIFLIFAPSEMHFAPLIPPQKISGAARPATGPRNPPWAPTGVKVPWSLKC